MLVCWKAFCFSEITEKPNSFCTNPNINNPMIIKKDKSEIEVFLVDAANFTGHCEAVYFPEFEEEIISIIKNANKNGLKITIAGNGTGLTGARVPEGGIVISMSKMDKIIELDAYNNFAIVQPAVVLRDFQDAVSEINLFYPPDPTEQNSFIGGNIATNASGAKSFKYGPTRNYVLEMKIVLPSGEVLKLKRGEKFAVGNKLELITENNIKIIIDLPSYSMPKTKHAAGFYTKENLDAIDLFIGSEGTLGVITEAKLKLLDAPEKLISGVVFFENENNAFNFVDEARNESLKHRNSNNFSNINARGIEFFDFFSLQFLKEGYPQIKDYHKAAIWFEQETDNNSEDELTQKWLNLLEKYSADIENTWFAVDNSELEKFKDFRHLVSSKVSEYVNKMGFRKVGTDTAVPAEEYRKFYYEMIQDVKNAKLNYVCYGHIGDCHFHLNMLPKTKIEFEECKKLYNTFCIRAAELGGTISAEHGIGKMKRENLLDMYGFESIKQMAHIKNILDPNRIMGIGNMFEEKYLYD